MTFIKFFNQIKTIPNKPLPKCIDCKNYSLQDTKSYLIGNTKYVYSEAKCLKNIVPCSLTGVYKPDYAYIARSENSMCGLKGLKFEPIKKN